MSRDYARLVSASAGAALLAVAAKASAVVTIANLQGAPLRPRLAFGWFPYVEVLADRATFSRIVTLSTATMAAVAALRLLPGALRGHADRDLVTGRLLGVVVAVETFGLETVRHLVAGPVLAWPEAGAALTLLGVAVAAGTVAAIRAGAGPVAAPVPSPATAARRPETGDDGRRPPPPSPRLVMPTAMLSLPPDPFAWDRHQPIAGMDDDRSPAAR